MKSFKQFMQSLHDIQEVKGDFGADVRMGDQPVNCYGQTVKYAMAPGKKVCKKRSSSSAGGKGE